MAFTFTPIVTDTFQRGNESPLDPTKWQMNGGLPVNDQLCIVNDEATTTIQFQADGQGTYIDDSLPNDQYIEVEITTLGPAGVVIIYMAVVA